MKHLFFIFCVFTLVSCDYFDKKKISTEEILQEELQTFNWNDVDEYPTFASCDTTSGKANKKNCFETTLRNILNENLSKHNIVVSEDVNDTVILKIKIDSKGQFTIEDIKSSDVTRQQIPELDSLLTHSFDSLPKIYPAIKRSQQVTTQFNLPVIVSIN